MGIFNWKIGDRARRNLQRALYQFTIHDGQPNIILDDPGEYISKGYAGNTSVYSIINRVDAMRKQASLTLKRKLPDGTSEVVTDHELLKFARKVNKSMTTNDFITAYIIYRMALGESFTKRIILDAGINKGKVFELHMLPSQEVEIIEGTMFEPIRGYKIEGSWNVEFPANEVYHSKLLNPDWFETTNLHGMSPLKAAAKTVSKLNEIELTELKQIQNQSPPYIFYRDSGSTIQTQRFDDEQQKQWIKNFINHNKEKTRGLPLISKEKIGKIDLGKSLADLSVIESSKEGIIALCAVYGLPPELFGYGQKTYNNMGTARKSAWTDCIIPIMNTFADDFTQMTITDTPFETHSLYWSMDYSDVEELSEGMKDKVDWMRNAHWSINEIRKATGQDTIDDPNADQPIMQMSESFLSDLSTTLDGQQKDYSDYINEK